MICRGILAVILFMLFGVLPFLVMEIWHLKKLLAVYRKGAADQISILLESGVEIKPVEKKAFEKFLADYQ